MLLVEVLKEVVLIWLLRVRVDLLHGHFLPSVWHVHSDGLPELTRANDPNMRRLLGFFVQKLASDCLDLLELINQSAELSLVEITEQRNLFEVVVEPFDSGHLELFQHFGTSFSCYSDQCHRTFLAKQGALSEFFALFYRHVLKVVFHGVGSEIVTGQQVAQMLAVWLFDHLLGLSDCMADLVVMLRATRSLRAQRRQTFAVR